MSYTSFPTAPMKRDAAVRYLFDVHEVDGTPAEALLTAAVESASGMAPLRREGRRTVWVTHLTTQDGKFIIESE